MDCTTEAAASGSLLGLRVGGLFGILAVSSVGVFLPLFAMTKRLNSLFFVLRAMAAGVVLSTGFVHVLGDAFPILSDPCLNLSTTYPWAMTFATFSTLFTFVLEFYLGKCFKKRAAQLTARANASAGEENPSSVEQGDEKAASRERARLMYTTASLTFECGIIFHSIFIGITLGITSDPDTAKALAIALMFHQFCEGLALGATFVKAEYSLLKYCILGFAFLIVTPIGVAIGIGVGGSYQSESPLALGFEGAFDSLAAGILIYNAIADLILPTFDEEEMPASPLLQALAIVFLFVGAGIMSLIAKWA
jgi:zinc transporter 1/2/3